MGNRTGEFFSNRGMESILTRYRLEGVLLLVLYFIIAVAAWYALIALPPMLDAHFAQVLAGYRRRKGVPQMNSQTTQIFQFQI